MTQLSEAEIKKIARAEYQGLKESYPSLTLDFVEQKVRDVLAGKVEGVIAMFIKGDLEEANML